MRRPLLALGLVALVAAAASAAALNPKGLVLQKADVPRGYEQDETQVLGNPGPGATASFRQLAKRSGRVTGYYAHYVAESREITSVAEVFRRPAGAKIYFKWYEDRLAREGEGARAHVAIGGGGWVYRVRSTPRSTFVLWRDGRIVESVLTHAMSDHRELALALARKQDARRAGAATELPATR